MQVPAEIVCFCLAPLPCQTAVDSIATKICSSALEQLGHTELMNLLILRNVLPPAVGLEMSRPVEPPYFLNAEPDAAALVMRLWPCFKPAG